jgi:hypothetical protein
VIPTAFFGLFLILCAVVLSRWSMPNAHAAAQDFIEAIKRPAPKPIPEPDWDPLAFWLFPDWDAAGDRPCWMVPPKKPLQAMNEYERGLTAGQKLRAEIEAMAVDKATKERMLRDLALRLSQQNGYAPSELVRSASSEGIVAYRYTTGGTCSY